MWRSGSWRFMGVGSKEIECVVDGAFYVYPSPRRGFKNVSNIGTTARGVFTKHRFSFPEVSVFVDLPQVKEIGTFDLTVLPCEHLWGDAMFV
jgi:hypothetical protein